MKKYDKTLEESENNVVNEPRTLYESSCREELRMVSMTEAVASSITLDELDRHLTELIHAHYKA